MSGENNYKTIDSAAAIVGYDLTAYPYTSAVKCHYVKDFEIPVFAERQQ